MAETFQIDDLEMEMAVLTKLARAAQTPVHHDDISETALGLLNRALHQDSFTLADQLVKLALDEAQKADDTELSSKAEGRIAEVAEAARAYEGAKAARLTLEKTPDDPEANLIVGKYLCFVKGDWDKGLLMLALGRDEALKALAQKALENVTSSVEQAKLGDAWWNLAEKQEALAKKHIQAWAAYWYRQALPGLTGLRKDRVEKRLAQSSDIEEPTTMPLTAQQAAAERQVAEWVLAKKGYVVIVVDGQFQSIKMKGTLPANPFVVRRVFYDYNSTSLTDEDLMNLQPLSGIACMRFDGPNTITDKGLRQLEHFTCLETLSLSGSTISDNGMDTIAKFTHLRALCFFDVHITDEGLERLRGLKRLAGLAFFRVPITDTGVEHLASHRNLNMLNLSGARITDKSLADVAGLVKLRYLCVRETNVTDKGLIYLQRMTCLEDLDLTNTKVTDKGIQAFKRALPDCRVTFQGHSADSSTATPQPEARTQDVLKLLIPARHTAWGSWQKSRNRLTTKQWSGIMIPISLHGSYDLQMQFVRLSGNNEISVLFPVGANRCQLFLGFSLDENGRVRSANRSRGGGRVHWADNRAVRLPHDGGVR